MGKFDSPNTQDKNSTSTNQPKLTLNLMRRESRSSEPRAQDQLSKKPSKKADFKFTDLFCAIENAVNTAGPHKTVSRLISDVENTAIKPTKAFPVAKKIKRHIKEKYKKNKHVGKVFKKMCKHFDHVKKQKCRDNPIPANEFANFLGGLIFMSKSILIPHKRSIDQNDQSCVESAYNDFPNSKECFHCYGLNTRNSNNSERDSLSKTSKISDAHLNNASAPNRLTTNKTKESASKERILEERLKECTECDEEIEGDYYACSECEGYFVCPDCEEDTEHDHVFYKIRQGRKYRVEGGSCGPKVPITNFPVPDSLGVNCSDSKIDVSQVMRNFDFNKFSKSTERDDGMRKIKKALLRPAVISTPEGPLIGKTQQYVIAQFEIQNQSKHKLPKKLYLKKTSDDICGFATIEDIDALGPGESKIVQLPILLPTKLGTYKLTFSYYTQHGRKQGTDLYLTIICES
ncbi:unnamed protein product [Moneuplotes crassus]|uniref:Uncharacterized protein n=1 Tax=Euplotes crassus TaxID=5936 RepID=A0AAD1UC51_EUPCR|nr:unnamed protein product [Moneuplotes crassus]